MHRFKVSFLLFLLFCTLPLWAESPYARSKFADNPAVVEQLYKDLKQAKTYDEALKIEFDILDIWHKSSSVERARELMWLGIISLEQEELYNALLMFNGAIEHDPEWAEAWNKRAAVNFFMGNYDASLHDVREALSRKPHHFGALTGLGHLLAKKGKFEKSIETYQKALDIHPHLKDAQFMLATLIDMQREKPHLFMKKQAE